MFTKIDDNTLGKTITDADGNETVATYTVDFLNNQLESIEKQKVKMVAEADAAIESAGKHKDGIIALRDAETAEVNSLLAKCEELGVF